MIDHLSNLLKSAATWARRGFAVPGRQDLSARIKSCQECPHYRGGTAPYVVWCGHCNCTAVKLTFATEACPVGRWGPVVRTE